MHLRQMQQQISGKVKHDPNQQINHNFFVNARG
jgi:hypothetical protein